MNDSQNIDAAIEHLHKILEANRQRSRLYYERNKERVQERQRLYYQANKEKYRQRYLAKKSTTKSTD